ncbi:hypothetical protein BP5796_03899 [Coleophoma crateriformis]|uniref:Yeast cell wall synthesis Kre9/Knh1-like N-terminal domain-containing protein n=1 Tax=Coleophoma crateriformis TaxID=565419 RepID=A0A3D8SHE2_9HELO|nr:hypothetical protein BP5796_03899 [Coleophoma crateriformis]
MPSYRFISLAALIAVAQAITVTSPTKNTLWNSDNANTITWTSVSTDPTTVDIYLVHQASQPQISDLLFSNVDISKGSVDVTGLQLPTGEAYQINFVKPETTAQIYAQSEQFNVTGTAASATSTLAGYTGPTATPSPSSTSSTSSSSSSSAVSSSTSSASGESSGTSTLTSSSGTASTLLTTSTGSSTTSTGTITTTDSATGASTTATGTSTSSSSATSSSATGNAAAAMTGSAKVAAMVLGAVAMFA